MRIQKLINHKLQTNKIHILKIKLYTYYKIWTYFKYKEDKKLIEDNTSKENFEKKKNIYKNRLKLINYFIQTKSKPNWMTIKYLPVLPPNLRPIVKLQDKTIIITDVNFLYSNIININNKIMKLRKMFVPETFLYNEKISLQDKVDKLIHNEKISNNDLKSNNMRHKKYKT